MPLIVAPCRTLCDWAPAAPAHDAAQLFACRGCGSQWLPGQPWTPSQADGTRPPGVREAVAAERARSQDVRGAGGHRRARRGRG